MKINKILAIIIFSLLNIKNLTAQEMSKLNAHRFSFNSIDGKEISLAKFKNRPILIVNTASKCGFTPQYKSLVKLHKKYKDQGLVIIGVPSADFGNQEFSDKSEVKEFTDEKFNIEFLLTEINHVSGDKAHPFYLWANKEVGFFAAPKWNFHKYLIDKNGNISAWFSSATDPMSSKIQEKIKENL